MLAATGANSRQDDHSAYHSISDHQLCTACSVPKSKMQDANLDENPKGQETKLDSTKRRKRKILAKIVVVGLIERKWMKTSV
mmetsp:Transcript_26245/g.73257  ORF Transcript_26245/g.73257 Transcript_26245/m.73257 type:complete len:82 (+) Transcript_26245:1141-1386(+)